MFLAYYGLRENPFEVTAAPRYLYPSPTHRESLGALHYGIEKGESFLALIGDPGSGKTTLLQQLARRSALSGHEILFLTLGLDTCVQNLNSAKERIKASLATDARTGRLLVIIDEIQHLDDATFEALGQLFDLHRSNRERFQMVLAAPPAVAKTLIESEFEKFGESVAVAPRINRLAHLEVQRYIHHRLRVAGSVDKAIFTPDAFPVIAHRSGGIPRVINNICYKAIKFGAEHKKERINAELVEIAVFGDAPRVSLDQPFGDSDMSFPLLLDSFSFHFKPRSWRRLIEYSFAIAVFVLIVAGAAIIWQHHQQAPRSIINPPNHSRAYSSRSYRSSQLVDPRGEPQAGMPADSIQR
jgi:general secretion pathway protein A